MSGCPVYGAGVHSSVDCPDRRVGCDRCDIDHDAPLCPTTEPAEQPPEVPAPDEVFALVVGLGGLAGKIYGIREVESDARRDLADKSDHVVRYVRAREGGR